MMSLTTFATEVKSGLVAKYDQQDMFAPVQDFSFNRYHSNNPATVKAIITVYYNDLQGREDVQEYLISECQTAIIENPTNNQSERQMITVTIKTEDSCESVPVRDDTGVKDISLYLFNEYTTKGIKYTLNLHKNKELN